MLHSSALPHLSRTIARVHNGALRHWENPKVPSKLSRSYVVLGSFSIKFALSCSNLFSQPFNTRKTLCKFFGNRVILLWNSSQLILSLNLYFENIETILKILSWFFPILLIRSWFLSYLSVPSVFLSGPSSSAGPLNDSVSQYLSTLTFFQGTIIHAHQLPLVR